MNKRIKQLLSILLVFIVGWSVMIKAETKRILYYVEAAHMSLFDNREFEVYTLEVFSDSLQISSYPYNLMPDSVQRFDSTTQTVLIRKPISKLDMDSLTLAINILKSSRNDLYMWSPCYGTFILPVSTSELITPPTNINSESKFDKATRNIVQYLTRFVEGNLEVPEITDFTTDDILDALGIPPYNK